jgi:hypothetical protein
MTNASNTAGANDCIFFTLAPPNAGHGSSSDLAGLLFRVDLPGLRLLSNTILRQVFASRGLRKSGPQSVGYNRKSQNRIPGSSLHRPHHGVDSFSPTSFLPSRWLPLTSTKKP